MAVSAPAAPAAPTEPSDAELAAILFPTGASPKGTKPAAIAEDDAGTLEDAPLALAATDVDDTDDEHDDPAERPAATAEADDEGLGTNEADAEETPAETDDAEQPTEGDDAEEADIKAIRAKFTPEQQKLFDKAIGKKAKKAIELRTQLQQRDTALQQAQAALAEALDKQPALPITPTAENPLADVESEAALEQRLAQARATRRWARSHPQGGQIGEHEVSAEQAASMLEDADALLEEHAPKQRALLQSRAQADTQAAKFYPWLADKTSPGARAVEAELKRYPQLRAIFPAARLMIADLLVMAQQRQQQAGKPGAAGGKPAPGAGQKPAGKAPTTPAGGTRPPKIAGTTKAAGAAAKTLAETGDDPNNAALRFLLRSA